MMGENIQFLVYNSNSFLPFSTAAQARTLAPARGLQPNPAKEYTVVNYSTDKIKEKKSIALMDMKGNVLIQNQVFYAQDQITIDISNLPNGAYLVTLFVNGQVVHSEKLLIQR